MAEEKSGKKVIALNREARHEYFVVEALETGIELVGTEVKSLRAGGANLKDSWADIDDGELIVKGMHISPYDHGNIFNKDPRQAGGAGGQRVHRYRQRRDGHRYHDRQARDHRCQDQARGR